MKTTAQQPALNPALTTLSAWIDAFNAHELDRLCALYAEEAVLWGTFAARLINSPSGVRDYFSNAFARKLSALVEAEALQVQQLGSVAICSGPYVIYTPTPSGTLATQARFSWVVSAQRGDWQIVNHHSSLTPMTTVSGGGE